MIVSMVVAMTRNRVIGTRSALPWYLPEDLRRFKSLTDGHAIVMGRRTFDGLPRVLPGREHYVVTRSEHFMEENPKALGNSHVFAAPDPVSALAMTEERLELRGDIPEEVFVIGGGEIFLQLLPYASRLYVTLVKRDVEGDTYFPVIEPDEWTVTSCEEHDGFDFLVYERNA